MAYQRKTYDEYEIQGNCGYGWDVETTEDTYKEAKAQAKRRLDRCLLVMDKQEVRI